MNYCVEQWESLFQVKYEDVKWILVNEKEASIGVHWVFFGTIQPV